MSPRQYLSLLVTSVVVAAPLATVFAQPAGSSPPSTEPAEPVVSSEDRDPAFALALPIVGAVGSIALWFAADETEEDALYLASVAGMALAPGMGHFYARDYKRGMLLSMGGIGSAGLLLTGAVACFDLLTDDPCGTAGSMLMLGGAMLGAGTYIWAFADARAAVRRQNAERRRELTLIPAPLSGPERSTGFGLTLSGRF